MAITFRATIGEARRSIYNSAHLVLFFIKYNSLELKSKYLQEVECCVSIV